MKLKNNFTLEGIIKEIKPVVKGTSAIGKEWSKKEIIIENNYSSLFSISLWNNSIEKYNYLNIGDFIECSGSLSSNQNANWINISLSTNDIKVLNNSGGAIASPQNNIISQNNIVPQNSNTIEEDEDFPF